MPCLVPFLESVEIPRSSKAIFLPFGTLVPSCVVVYMCQWLPFQMVSLMTCCFPHGFTFMALTSRASISHSCVAAAVIKYPNMTPTTFFEVFDLSDLNCLIHLSNELVPCPITLFALTILQKRIGDRSRQCLLRRGSSMRKPQCYFGTISPRIEPWDDENNNA